MSKNEQQDASDLWACQLKPSDDYLSEADFIQPDGTHREVTVSIEKVTRERLQLPGQRDKELRTVIAFARAKKRFVLGAKINIKRIESQLGSKVADWIGKKIALCYDPNVRFGKKVVGGIRVKGKQ